MHAAGKTRPQAGESRTSHVIYGAVLVVCAVAFWAALPVLWFVVGHILETRGASKSLAILVTHGGVVLTVACAVQLISFLQRAYTGQWLLPRGAARKHSPDEPLIVLGACLAIVGGVIWLALGGGCASAPQVCPL